MKSGREIWLDDATATGTAGANASPKGNHEAISSNRNKASAPVGVFLFHQVSITTLQISPILVSVPGVDLWTLADSLNKTAKDHPTQALLLWNYSGGAFLFDRKGERSCLTQKTLK